MHDDPLSAASAGLVALGIERSRRVDVLEVLGCLLDHADPSGDVVLDRELFSHEESLGVDKCLDAYALLEQLDVVSRTDNGWTITDYRFHEGPAGETEASLAVLRKHLASIGVEAPSRDLEEVAFEQLPAAAAVAVVIEPAPIVPIKRWRRAVPVAAGIAASAAAFVGATQLVPQAAVSGRNAALSSDAPTTIVAKNVTPSTNGVRGTVLPNATVGSTVTSALAGTSTTQSPASPLDCLLPQVLTSVKSIDIVRLPLGGKNGETIWAAVVKGTATLTNSDTSLLLPALNVVAHLADGDTDAVQATLGAPLLVPDKASAFNAVVALGATKPTSPVTATAKAAGLQSC